MDEVGKVRDEVSTRLRERTDEIVQLESKLNDANVATQKSSDADEKMKAQAAELARLREKLQSTESAMSALSADNETLQQKASATDELGALKEDIAKKASSIGTLEGQVKQMKQKFDNAVKKGKGFQEQTATLTSRLQDAEEKITEMAFEKQALTERLVEMESLRQELTS